MSLRASSNKRAPLPLEPSDVVGRLVNGAEHGWLWPAVKPKTAPA